MNIDSHEEAQQRQQYDLQCQEEQAKYDTYQEEMQEIDYLKRLLKESLFVLNWNMEHTKVWDEAHQSDFFNLNANIISQIEKVFEKHDEQSICNVDDLPF